MTKQELAQRTKQKYPQYAGMDDNELADKIIAKYPVYQSQIQEDKPSVLSGLKDSLSKRAESFGETWKDTASGKINPAQTGLQTWGAVAGGASDIIGAGIMALLPKSSKEKLGEVTSKVMETEVAQKATSAYNEFKVKHPEAAKDLNAALNIASFAPIGLGVGAGKKVLNSTKEVLKKVKPLGKGVIPGVKKTGTELAKEIGEKATKIAGAKPKTPLGTVGQVLQGKTTDIETGLKSLSLVNTTKVKTFKQLSDKIKGKITDYAKIVDTNLAKDPTKVKLKNLTITAKTKAGTVVKSNPVKRALEQLDEMYGKIGDGAKQAEIKDLAKLANKEGLTRLEINNLAKQYGQEFGRKAFGKLGDPLTSVNAKLFENTRKALKDVARGGITGAEAKAADLAMTNLYSTRRLIQNNVEAVNKIAQKINERGLFEKIGYNVSKYADILTGGSIRGFVGGILPRGAGYKTLNALDLEKVLSKNLKLINDAIKSGSDAEIVRIIKQLEINPKASIKLKPSATRVVPKAGTTESVKLAPKKVNDFIKKSYKEAPKAKKEIDSIATDFAKKYNGVAALAPLKKQDKVLFNIKNKYNGDMTKVTDIARNTIVVDNPGKVFTELKNKKGYFSGKYVDPTKDPLGYSGYNTKFKASNGHIAEIQINSPGMIYAKEPAESAIAQLGKKLYDKLNKQYGGIGGKGHKYYDKWALLRSQGKIKESNILAKKSQKYYSKFK